ncbi:MAG: class F sortase [bacterium]|nr:class F sortase [bacterium]
MLTVKSKRYLAHILIVIAVLIFSFVLFRAFYYAPSDEVPFAPAPIENIESQAASVTPAVTGKPVQLVIPKINIDTKIQHVGITSKGNMASPNNFVDAGWYKYGTIPGNRGSAVIAGHVNNGIAFPAIFYDLKKLEPGDEILVTNENDELLRFIVTGSKTYAFDGKADEVFTEDSGKLLKLITCTGTWVKKYGTHDQRLVVSAVLSE